MFGDKGQAVNTVEARLKRAVTGCEDKCHKVQFVLEARLAVTEFGDRCHQVQFVLEAHLVLSQGLWIGVTEFRFCWKHI